MLSRVLFAVCGCLLFLSNAITQAAERPNILWIVVEDMSADFACYGEKTITTPHVDQLAADGVKFTNAVVTSPVCSTCRSALITGMYQTTIGAHQHRSGRGVEKIHLPEGVKLAPELFNAAGYQSLNLSVQEFLKQPRNAKQATVKVAKTDYNFEYDPKVFSTKHWTKRDEGQPFFAQIQLRGGKLRGHGDGDAWPKKVKETLGSTTSKDEVKLPPYLPEHPVILEDWAQYLDTVRYTDWEVGQIVKRLKEAGELDNTYLFFITDHGVSHVRNKQFCYDGGVHIPLIIRGPGIKPGSLREDPVEHIDLVATSLSLANIEQPKGMQSRDILASDYTPRKMVFSARDRCDETVERIRSVRTKRFKYIRNFYPKRPYLQPNAYKDAKPIQITMRKLHAEGKLNAAQSLIMRETRPKEELYDLKNDPYELNNLIENPNIPDVTTLMRQALNQWIVSTGDKGATPESVKMYDSDMKVYVDGIKRRGRLEHAAIIEKNIATMKRWAKEGR